MKTSQAWDVIVIGGGAAGFFAAITAAQDNPACRVLLLERSSQVLAKVKISGGGRCNVTHACFEPAQLVGFYPRGGQALRGPFSRFQPRDTVAWFETRGVALKTEADGRMFPTTDSSQTILDCLMKQARMARVTLMLNVNVKTVQKNLDDLFEVVMASEEKQLCKRLILATGSSPLGWECAQALGHTLESPVPSLFTLTIKDPRLHGLSGLSVPQARVSIEGTTIRQEGPLLITHWGLSGPAVLKLSAWGARVLHEKNYRASIHVQWDTSHTSDEWLTILRQIRTDSAKKMAAFPTNPLRFPQRLWARFIAATGITETTRWSDVSNEQLLRLIQELNDSQFQMEGKSPFKDEFVTCGGIRLNEVDFRTMESKRCDKLYFAGEILDIDAVTGGFNFQNAWTTGWLAGISAGQVLAR